MDKTLALSQGPAEGRGQGSGLELVCERYGFGAHRESDDSSKGQIHHSLSLARGSEKKHFLEFHRRICNQTRTTGDMQNPEELT